jgi:hypothetical protein
MRRVYVVLRDLHLYAGLFVSPFVLVFALSVFYLVHGLSIRPSPEPKDGSRVVKDLRLPAGLESLDGPARIEALRAVLTQIDVKGEIDFVRHAAKEHRLIFPVRVPNADALVDLDYEQRIAIVTARRQSWSEAFVYLHKMPGPHNAAIRGNSALITAWRVVADATVYLTLFLTVSGLYLWVVLKSERRVGTFLLLAGALTFGGLVYGLAG